MELMLAITVYNYFKPAAGVPAERSLHSPSFDYERNKKCASITVIADIVGDGHSFFLFFFFNVRTFRASTLSSK